jgi:hypothetical protein
MEVSEVGRLPPELWNKVIRYLIFNDGFYRNPELLGILDQIPDAIHGGFRDSVRQMIDSGYTHREFQDLRNNPHEIWTIDGRKWMVDPRAPMGEAYDFREVYHIGQDLTAAIVFSLTYTADNNILIHEAVQRKCETLGTEAICRRMNGIYNSIRFLPFGIRIQLESECDPCHLMLMYPVEVAGRISFMTRRIRKVFIDKPKEGFTRCLTRIDLGFLFPFRGLRSPKWNGKDFDSTYLSLPVWKAFAKHCGFGKGYRYHKQVTQKYYARY